MPKQKTRSTAKKRFSLTKNGLIKRGTQHRRHILTKKAKDRKLRLKKSAYVSKADAKNIMKMINND